VRTEPRTGLVAASGAAVDLGALDGQQVVERHQSLEARLPVPARQEDQQLALGCERRLRDPALERFEGEPRPLGEVDEARISGPLVGLDTFGHDRRQIASFRADSERSETDRAP
jgi:hypothetical protein